MDSFSQCVSHNNTIKNDTVLYSFSLGHSDCCLLRRGCKLAIEPPGIMSSFQVGRKQKGQRIKGFFLERCASYPGKSSLKTCPNTSLNCFTWPPLAVKSSWENWVCILFPTPQEKNTRGEDYEWHVGGQSIVSATPPPSLIYPAAIKCLC